MILLLIMLWVFLPTVLVIVLAGVLSAFGVKPPKPRSNLSWHEKRDW
jgi:hypothetical protein